MNDKIYFLKVVDKKGFCLGCGISYGQIHRFGCSESKRKQCEIEQMNKNKPKEYFIIEVKK